MMDAVYVALLLGIFLASVSALGSFARGQGRRAGREE
jgi:hypothetical protein